MHKPDVVFGCDKHEHLPLHGTAPLVGLSDGVLAESMSGGARWWCNSVGLAAKQCSAETLPNLGGDFCSYGESGCLDWVIAHCAFILKQIFGPANDDNKMLQYRQTPLYTIRNIIALVVWQSSSLDSQAKCACWTPLFR